MMSEKKLVHFIEWKKLTEEEQSALFAELPSWGVRDLVAHPVWGKRAQAEKGYLNKIRGELADAGLRTPACHAFWGRDYDLYVTDGEIRRRHMEEHRTFLKQLAEMEVGTYTIHLGNGPDVTDRVFCWDQIRRSVDDLLPCCEECGIVLALENGYDELDELEKLAALVKSYQCRFIGMCYDTGHANCYTSSGWQSALEVMRPYIATCHLHDNHGGFDDHNPPGDGNLNWTELIPALKKCPNLLHAETESGDWSRIAWDTFRAVWKYE